MLKPAYDPLRGNVEELTLEDEKRRDIEQQLLRVKLKATMQQVKSIICCCVE